MPKPITHFLVCERAMKNAMPDLWKDFTNFAWLGSFGPDLFYSVNAMAEEEYLIRVMRSISGIRHEEITGCHRYTEISDVLHWESALDFFCCMLEHLKKYSINSQHIGKLKAFVYGYYSHVISDCIFHPFIYRRSRDHWLMLTEMYYQDHKAIETIIDTFLLDKLHRTDPNYKFIPQMITIADFRKGIFDKDLVAFISTNLGVVYQDRIGFPSRFINGGFELDKHPVNLACSHYLNLVRSGLYSTSLIHWDIFSRDCVRPRANFCAEVSENWLGCSFSYSTWDLFAFAVKATENVIAASEEYLCSDLIKASDFFQNTKMPYLRENYCLDTGLPSRENTKHENQSLYQSERFGFGVETIGKNYAYLKMLLQ